MEVEKRTLTVPMVDPPGGAYAGRRVEVTLTPKQAETLRALRYGLQHANERTESGGEIETVRDVVRWVLDKLAVTPADSAAPVKRPRGRPPKSPAPTP